MNETHSRPPASTVPAPDRPYLPGMGRDWLLPLYDPFTRLIGAEAAHRQLADEADLAPAQRALEIGCGTGNLALLIKRRYPRLTMAGLDPDPKALARAARKAERAGLALQLDRGFADQLPYPDASFDRVLSSLMFHHLDADQRAASLREVLRVLRPGGTLHLMDLSGDGHHLHGLTRIARRRDALKENFDEIIPAQLREAGFGEPAITSHLTKHIGSLTYYRATRPVSQT
jgi:ubiquinone/menaquinone biosynthesis C-methylase UbiE